MPELKPKYIHEEIVYLKTDPELLPRMVTAYKVSKFDITYELICGTSVSYHYDYEIAKSKEEIKGNIGFK